MSVLPELVKARHCNNVILIGGNGLSKRLFIIGKFAVSASFLFYAVKYVT